MKSLRAALAIAVEPMVAKFTAALIAAMTADVDAHLAGARAAALDHLRASMEVLHVEKRDAEPDRAPAVEAVPAREVVAERLRLVVDRDDARGRDRARATESAPSGEAEAAAPARVNTCSKCGARGFTAKTCGRTHNVVAQSVQTPALASPPPCTSKSDRFARIEAAARARQGTDE